MQDKNTPTHGEKWSARLHAACRFVLDKQSVEGKLLRTNVKPHIREASERFSIKESLLYTILIDRG